MWVIIESSKGSEKFGAMRLLQNKCMWQSQTLLRKASDKVSWFFLLLQGNYSFLFPFRQWAAKWGVQQPRLHFHPGRASAANRGPADPGETSDFVQWCAGHCQVQVRAIPTHSFSPARGGVSGAVLCTARCWTQWSCGYLPTHEILWFCEALIYLWSTQQPPKQCFFGNVALKCGISPFHLHKFFLVLMFHSICLEKKVV